MNISRKKKAFVKVTSAVAKKFGNNALSRLHPLLKLLISIMLDLVGMASYLVPVFGELTDGIYAPLYGLWIGMAYENVPMGIFGGLEEILPFSDAIPTATGTHIYRFIKERKAQKVTG